MDVSQNQYAETFIKTLGAQAGAPTFDGGVKAVESVLASWDIPPTARCCATAPGCRDTTTSRQRPLVRVLTRMYRDPAHREPFFSSLTVAGQPARSRAG